jgi:hypothetical protein
MDRQLVQALQQHQQGAARSGATSTKKQNTCLQKKVICMPALMQYIPVNHQQ